MKGVEKQSPCCWSERLGEFTPKTCKQVRQKKTKNWRIHKQMTTKTKQKTKKNRTGEPYTKLMPTFPFAVSITKIIIIAYKGATRDFLQSPHWAPRTVSNTYDQAARAQSSANYVQHIERLSRATRRVPRGTKGQLSYWLWRSWSAFTLVVVWGFFFFFFLLAETINRCQHDG